jgi:hypothetical protein
MHLADGVCHLLDRGYVLDDEPVRQKPLIDQLHHPLVSRVEPDRPEMLSTNLHWGQLKIKKLELRILWRSLRLLDDTRKIPSSPPQIDFRLIHPFLKSSFLILKSFSFCLLTFHKTCEKEAVI